MLKGRSMIAFLQNKNIAIVVGTSFALYAGLSEAQLIDCESSQSMTIQPFAEITENEAERYLPSLKQFNLSDFNEISGFDSRLFEEKVSGHKTAEQVISWRYLPSGGMRAQTTWKVDNWMGKYTLKRGYECRVAAAPSGLKSSTNVTENQSEQSDSVGVSSNQVAAVVPKPVENTSSSISVSSNNESVSVSSSSTYTKWRGAQSVEQAQQFANEIQASIVMFMAISEVIEKQPLSMKDRVLSVVGTEITRLQSEKLQLQEMLTSRFSTPIRPQNANLSVSAFRAADTFPKIPFYVPGTAEIGEMLVIPRVTDDGYLIYQFDFLDPTSTYDKVRDTIEVAHSDIQSMITGLHKIDEWTKVAQENNVNRRIEKTSSCIPEGLCAEKKQGVSSTEVVFQIYEDGSTAGRIQRNKGKFAVGYNMSVESSILLSAYLTYMKEVGSKEFNIGVMTDKEVEKLFN